MRHLFGAICVVCLIAAGCGQQPAGDPESSTDTAKKPAKTLEGSDDKDDFLVGEPVAWKNLTIYPVMSKEPKNDDRYITLEEGLKSGKVEVLEVGAQFGDTEPAQDIQNPAQDIQNPAPEDSAVQDTEEEDVAAEGDPFGEPEPEAEPETANQESDPFGGNNAVVQDNRNNPLGNRSTMSMGTSTRPRSILWIIDHVGISLF